MTRKDKAFYALAAAFALAVTYTICIIFLQTPTAQLTAGGLAQKIFYFHVGVALGIHVTGGRLLLGKRHLSGASARDSQCLGMRGFRLCRAVRYLGAE